MGKMKMQLYTDQGCLMESSYNGRGYDYSDYNDYNDFIDDSYIDDNVYDKKEKAKTKRKIKSKLSWKFKRRVFLLAIVGICFFGRKYIKPLFINSANVNCQAVTQSKKYYCGPASVKVTLGAINNISKSQDSYASELGTTEDGTASSNIATVLNNNQDKWDYKLSTCNTSYNTFVKGIKKAVSNGCPVIVDINTDKCDSKDQEVWGYSVSGHYVTVVGYDFSDGKEIVYIHDSHYENPASNKKMECKTLFRANQNHADQPVIW